ncbi:hypothetical protein [Limnothrix redekei]|uniref:Uncharacterized protein n=1 Tax=Limnothrix redekei LRLZ20PSL1 TaxID=3112953 RepID=A0ABW7CGF0_9CYAN
MTKPAGFIELAGKLKRLGCCQLPIARGALAQDFVLHGHRVPHPWPDRPMVETQTDHF